MKIEFDIIRVVAQPNVKFKVGDRVVVYYASYGDNSESWLEARRPESDVLQGEVAIVTAVAGRNLDVMVVGIFDPKGRQFVKAESNAVGLIVEIGDAR